MTDGYCTALAVVEVDRSGCDSSHLPVVLAEAPLDFASHLPALRAHVLASCHACRVVHLLVCLAPVADVFSGCSVGGMALGFVLRVPEGLVPLACCFALHSFCFLCYIAGDDSLFPLVFQAR